MNNNNIIWKWNPVTEEWELPEFPKIKLAKVESKRIILDEVIEKLNATYGEALRKLALKKLGDK